jgi:hypothetical protein
MAIYYVRNDGNDSNTGTGPATNQAWQSLQKALGATSGLVGGDIVYVAPGRYTEFVTVGITSPSSQVRIVGDPSASQFSGITPGVVLWTTMNALGTNITTYLLFSTSKNNLSFENFYFELASTTNNQIYINLVTSQNIQFKKCLIDANGTSTNTNILLITNPVGQAVNATIDSCIFNNGAQQLQLVGTSGVADTSVVKNCLFIGAKSTAFLPTSMNVDFVNNTVIGAVTGIAMNPNSSIPSTIRNSLFVSCQTAGFSISNVGTTVTYSRCVGSAGFSNMTATTATNSFIGGNGLDNGYRQLHNLQSIFQTGSTLNSVNTSFGNATGAPTTDLFNVLWSGTSPDAGAITYRNLGTITPIYQPTERNASAITIAPASTSQSIELYLGSTGLTFATSGLAAYYVRNREAPTPITLVAAPTPTWVSGGFAEIDSATVPGLYRLDVPNAAFAAGASDVTIVVRGASGTNGAVLTVTLSSGGLTAAQTASAIFNAATTDYTANGTYGLNLLRADQQNKQGLVTLHSSGGINRVDADVHAIQNDAAAATYLKGALLHDGTGYVDADVVRVSTSIAAANELEGALLHNGTDYISAELLSPVSAATSVHIGPYQLLADGLGADQPLDVNVGTATSIDVQVTDANGTGIDITGATVTAKVYSSAGTLVATYAGTATYADNGRLSFGLTTTVTATSGTYTVTVTRTTGATDTQIFGPLRLYVRPV